MYSTRVESEDVFFTLSVHTHMCIKFLSSTSKTLSSKCNSSSIMFEIGMFNKGGYCTPWGFLLEREAFIFSNVRATKSSSILVMSHLLISNNCMCNVSDDSCSMSNMHANNAPVTLVYVAPYTGVVRIGNIYSNHHEKELFMNCARFFFACMHVKL